MSILPAGVSFLLLSPSWPHPISSINYFYLYFPLWAFHCKKIHLLVNTHTLQGWACPLNPCLSTSEMSFNVPAQLLSPVSNPTDCNPPGSSVHGIFQARRLEMGCHFPLQGIFPTQRLKLHLLHLPFKDSRKSFLTISLNLLQSLECSLNSEIAQDLDSIWSLTQLYQYLPGLKGS